MSDCKRSFSNANKPAKLCWSSGSTLMHSCKV
jgi:hypothetical protein